MRESSTRRERIPAGTIPSVLDLLAGRHRRSVRDAACAQEPYSTWPAWTSEPSGGSMPANTAVRLGEVCARCPVRPECLRDALSETRYTVEGWWGGTSRPERTKSLRQVAAEMAGDGQPIALWSPLGSDGVSSSLGREPRNAMDHAELVERTAQALEAGFEERLELWRSRRPGWRACEVCGTAFEVPRNERRPKQYCSLSCRQKAYYCRKKAP